MKKIFLFLAVMFAFCTTTYANEQKVDFIYVHGANQGPIKEFQDCLDKAHPYIIESFENSDFVSKNILKGATIDNNPKILFWADKTWPTKKALKKGLDISAQYTPKVPQEGKAFFAYLLHDSIWVQKYPNMRPIMDDLSKMIMTNYKNGEKTILVGYSAGTFITYQYMLNKYKFIETIPFLTKFQKELNLSKDEIALVKKYAPKYTCASALVDSQIAMANIAGEIVSSPNKDARNYQIKQLKARTESSCIPDDATIGVLNFGSPLTVFYSEVMNTNSAQQMLAIKLTEYLVETDKFFLTINYAKDPFGIPFPNRTYSELQSRLNKKIKNGHGFLYNKMLKGGRNIVIAHSLYWINPKPFAKDVAKALEEGYKDFYEIDKK